MSDESMVVNTNDGPQAVGLPPVAKRLHITSLPDYVDAAVEQLGPCTLNLADETTREQFRDWLNHELSGYLRSLAWDLSKGADRGLRQVLQLAEDPDYYQTVKKRRQAARAQQAKWAQEDRDKTPVPPTAQTMAKGIELPQAEYGIYHRDTFEEPEFQVSLIGQANSVEEARAFVAQKFGPRALGQHIRANGADRVELVRMTDRRIIETWNVG